MITAFRDTWELGIHSYLTYIRDRLKVAHDLLNDTGSVFVQISDENVHHVREICDEIFGAENFITMIYFRTTGGFETNQISRVGDYIVWYAKKKSSMKYHQLYDFKDPLRGDVHGNYKYIELIDGTRRTMTKYTRSIVQPVATTMMSILHHGVLCWFVLFLSFVKSGCEL